MFNKTNMTDLDAGYYVRHSALQKGLAQEVLERTGIEPGDRILDVGCGDGQITAEMAKRACRGRVLGVDASPNMVRFARSCFSKESFPQLDFLHGMAETIELDEQFDLITSFSCLHWVRDARLAMRRLIGLLRPSGRFVILTYPKESMYYRYLEKALMDFPEYYPFSANKTMLAADEYREVFVKNGMEVVFCEQKHLRAPYESCDEIKGYVRGWMNSYVPLPQELHEPFLDKVCHAMMGDLSICEGDSISVPYTALIIQGLKYPQL